MSCICGHSKADHWEEFDGTKLDCDLCDDCERYCADEALAAVEAHDPDPLAPRRLPIPASPTGAGQGPGGAL